MRSASRRGPLVMAAVGVGLSAILLDPLLAPRVPLYVPGACTPTDCFFPNTPQFPLFSLLAGAAYGFMVGRTTSWIGLGAAAGIGAALIGGVFVAAAIPFHEEYFATIYRVYALVYLGVMLFTISAWCVITLRRTGSPSVLPVVAAGSLAVPVAFVRGDVLIAGIGAFAIAAGVAASFVWDRVPTPRPNAPTVAAALLAVVAFAARAAFGLQTLARTGPGMAFAIASDDGDAYFHYGSLIANEGAWGEVLAALAFPPGYSVFVGTILGLSGGSLAMVIVSQAVIAAGATLLLYAIGSFVRGPVVGLLAAALFALDQNLVQNSSTLTAEALLMPALLLAIYSIARYRRAGSPRWLALGAGALAISFVTRNVAAFPLLVAVIVWLGWWRRSTPALLARDVGAILLAVLLFSLPIGAATYARDGTPRLTTQLAKVQWDFDGGPQMTISNNFLIERGIRPFEDPLGSAGAFLADPLPIVWFLIASAPQRLSTLLFFLSPGSTDPLLIANPLIYENPFGDTLTLLRQAGLLVGAAVLIRSRAWRTAPEISLVALYVGLYLAVFAFVFAPYHPFRYRIPIEPLRFMVEAIGLVVMASAVGSALGAYRRPTTSPSTAT